MKSIYKEGENNHIFLLGRLGFKHLYGSYFDTSNQFNKQNTGQTEPHNNFRDSLMAAVSTSRTVHPAIAQKKWSQMFVLQIP